jgi:hypothetical protein
VETGEIYSLAALLSNGKKGKKGKKGKRFEGRIPIHELEYTN